jgi:hypothetical protein
VLLARSLRVTASMASKSSVGSNSVDELGQSNIRCAGGDSFPHRAGSFEGRWDS